MPAYHAERSPNTRLTVMLAQRSIYTPAQPAPADSRIAKHPPAKAARLGDPCALRTRPKS